MSRERRGRAPPARARRGPTAARVSSQIGWPDGASAECGSDRPSASPTTCDVAAVPRNWQPPPGEPHARQPSSAASLERDQPVREARAERLHRGRRPRRRSAGSVTPPGTSTPGRSRAPGERHHHRREALVAGGDAEDAAPRRQRADQPPQHDRRVVAVRQAVEHPGRALRAAVARVGAEAGERHAAAAACTSRAAASTSRPTSQWPRVVAEGDGRFRRARARRRAC